MQTISRLYANEQSARKAWDELRSLGFADSYVFTPSSSAGETSAHTRADILREEMVKAYVARSEAAIYAGRVSQGASLVTVHAPFSGGTLAMTILDRNGPIDSGVQQPTSPPFLWDEAAPLSSALRWPILAKTELPFEAVSGIPSLIQTRHGSGAPVHPDDPAPFSASLGVPLLINTPTPLSSLFNFPVLLKSGPVFYQ
jgi:hypothetical protein